MAIVGNAPATLDLVVRQGSDFALTLTVELDGDPFDFTGATVTAKMINAAGAEQTSVAWTPTTSTGELVLTLDETATALIQSGWRYYVDVTKASITQPWVAGALSPVALGRGGRSSSTATLSITTDTGATLTISADPGQGVAAHLADTSDAHDASAISFAPSGAIAGTDVQTAVAEVASDAAAALAAHVDDTSDAHDASAISLLDTGGHWTATTVEGALAEVPSRYVSSDVEADTYQTGHIALDITSDTNNTVSVRQTSDSAVAVRMVQFGAGPVAKWKHGAVDVGFINANGSLLLLPEADAPGIYVSEPAWGAARAFAYSNKDGIFYVDNFLDASGDDSPRSYTKMFGGSMTKTGRGNVDAFWASVTHQGVEEAGLFIGDVSGSAGGNLWGAHFELTANTVEAQMYGLQAELVNNVAHAAKQKWGVNVRSSGSQDGTIGLLVDSKPAGAAGWTNYIVARNLAGTDVFKVTKEGCLTLTSASDGAEIIRFNTDRPWTLKQAGTGGSAALRLSPDTDTRVFEITSPNGTNKALTVAAHNTLGSHALRLMPHATGVMGFWGATPIARPTGWAAMTGTATRTAFATTTVTLEQLAQRVKALTDDLISMGLIGA